MKKYVLIALLVFVLLVLAAVIYLATEKALKNKSIVEAVFSRIKNDSGSREMEIQVIMDGLSAQKAIEAVDDDIRIISARLNGYGQKHFQVKSLGENRIKVSLVDRGTELDSLILSKGLLTLQLVTERNKAQSVIEAIDKYIRNNKQQFSELTQRGQGTGNASAGAFGSLFNSEKDDFLVTEGNEALLRKLLGSKEFLAAVPQGKMLAVSRPDEGAAKLFVLEKEAQISNSDLDKAEVLIGAADSYDPQIANKPYISVSLNQKGTQKFANITGANIDRRLAIVMDGQVFTAPVIRDRIFEGKMMITGNFSKQEARVIATLLSFKHLVAPVTVLSSKSIPGKKK